MPGDGPRGPDVTRALLRRRRALRQGEKPDEQHGGGDEDWCRPRQPMPFAGRSSRRKASRGWAQRRGEEREGGEDQRHNPLAWARSDEEQGGGRAGEVEEGARIGPFFQPRKSGYEQSQRSGDPPRAEDV